MWQRRRLAFLRSRAAFTVVEFAAVLFILAVLAAVLFPVFARPRNYSGPSCASNLKSVWLSLQGYAEDFDGKMPPAAGTCATDTGEPVLCEWAAVVPRPSFLDKNKPTPTPPMLLGPYCHNEGIFICPSIGRGSPQAGLTYMYNDLVAGAAPTQDAAVAAKVVLVAEGEDQPRNAGHAWEPESPAQPCIAASSTGPCLAGQGATVKTAPLRHSDGANYLLADGHIKWFKPKDQRNRGNSTVFFPSRSSDYRYHNSADGTLLGPDPAGNMTWNGHEFAATFHLR